MHSYLQDLCWDCCTAFFTHLYQSYGLDLRHNFISVQYLLHICTRVMALNILQNFISAQNLENKLTDFTKLYKTIYTDKIYMGLLAVILSKFVRELWPLIDVRIMLPLNILRHSGLLLHARHCSRAIVRFSDNSSLPS